MTRFSQQFVHLHTKTGPKDETALFAAILAEGINLGLSKMADACPTVTYTQLAWIVDWYISDENYTKALGVLSNFQRKIGMLPIGAMEPLLLQMDNILGQVVLLVH